MDDVLKKIGKVCAQFQYIEQQISLSTMCMIAINPLAGRAAFIIDLRTSATIGRRDLNFERLCTTLVAMRRERSHE